MLQVDRALAHIPEKEDYWFSTSLAGSVRDMGSFEAPAETASLGPGGATECLAESLPLEEALIFEPLMSRSVYELARRTVGTLFTRLWAKKRGEPEGLEQVARRMVTSLLLLPSDSYDLRSLLFSEGLYSPFYESFGKPFDLVDHSLNVAILSVGLAKARGASAEELVRLCLAALLHDVGMLLIPPRVWFHPRRLTARETAMVQYHTDLGRDLLVKLGKPFLGLASIVGQEHERADGGGYPLGLQGDEIEECAKIIGLVDVFEALTHGRPHRSARTPHRAVRTIVTEMRAAFDEPLLRDFLSFITIFPLGSYVELSTGEVGRVVRVDASNQLRPVVEVVQNPQGRPVEPPTARELQDLPDISIARCLEGLPKPPGGRVALPALEMVQ